VGDWDSCHQIVIMKLCLLAHALCMIGTDIFINLCLIVDAMRMWVIGTDVIKLSS
jgi:hypothetical protein